jgi:hypothetical protein
MSIIISNNVQVGQSGTANNNITLNTSASGDLVVNKGVWPNITEITRVSNTGLVDGSKVSFTPTGTIAATTVQAAIAELSTELTATSDASGITYTPAGTGAVATTVEEQLRKFVYASNHGCVAGLTTDQSVNMQAAFDVVKATGGKLIWEPGTYLGRIDFSGTVVSMDFEGQGAIFRPYSSAQTEVFYCKNSATYPTVSGSFSFLNVTFRNVHVVGRTLGASSDTDAAGHTNYGVNFICTSAKWYDSSFQYAKIAAYYGYYHQYGEFYSCLFGACVYSDSAIGCLLDGNTSSESSNENRFFGPKFFSNKNGLVIKGGLKNRIYSPTIQDTRFGGSAGIFLTTDSSGFGADGTDINGAYTEINNGVPAVLIGVAPNTTISSLQMLSAGEYIQSTHCYNLALRDVVQYNGGTIALDHPSGNSDSASVSVIGGNVKPSISGLTHAGPTYISMNQPALAKKQNDSVLLESGQLGTNSAQFVGAVDLFGVKASVAKATTTDLFSITQKSFASPASRISVFTVELFLWDSAVPTSQFGYSGHLQRYSVFITNNTTGLPQVFITAESSGIDVGLSTGFQAPGNVALSATVSGDVITFKANWVGAGTGVAGMTVQDVAYMLRGAGANGFYLTRL